MGIALRAAARAACLIAGVAMGTLTLPATAGVWAEVGDAGNDFLHPQITTGSGPLNSITGSLQPQDPITPDAVDFFKFFQPNDPIHPTDPIDVLAKWDDPALGNLDFGIVGLNGVVVAASFFGGHIQLPDLAPGYYLIAVGPSAFPDPTYTITFFTPAAFAAAPEPGSLALLGLGLAGLAATRRRKLH